MSSITPSSATSFFTLPFELRQIVYGHMLHPFSSTTTVGVPGPRCSHAPPRQTLPKILTNALLVSKDFAEEAKDVYYKNTTITQFVTLNNIFLSSTAGPDQLRFPSFTVSEHTENSRGAVTTKSTTEKTIIALPDRPDSHLIEKLEIVVLISAAWSSRFCVLCSYRHLNSYGLTDPFWNKDSETSVDEMCPRHGGQTLLVCTHGPRWTVPVFDAVSMPGSQNASSSSAIAAGDDTNMADGASSDATDERRLLPSLKHLTMRFTAEQDIREYSFRIPLLHHLLKAYSCLLPVSPILDGTSTKPSFTNTFANLAAEVATNKPTPPPTIPSFRRRVRSADPFAPPKPQPQHRQSPYSLKVHAHTSFSARNRLAEHLFRRGLSIADIEDRIERPLVAQVDPPLCLNGQVQSWLEEGKSFDEMKALTEQAGPRTEIAEIIAGLEMRCGEFGGGSVGNAAARLRTERLWSGPRDRAWEVVFMETWGKEDVELLYGGEDILRGIWEGEGERAME